MGVSGDVAVADLRDDLRAAAVATASANMDVDALMGLSGSLAFALEEEVPQCPAITVMAAITSIVAAFALAASAERHSARGGVDIEDMLKLHVGPTYQAHILALLVAGILAPMPASSAGDGHLAIDHPIKRRVRVGYFQKCLPVAMSLVVRLVAMKAYPFGALKQVLRKYMTPRPNQRVQPACAGNLCFWRGPDWRFARPGRFGAGHQHRPGDTGGSA